MRNDYCRKHACQNIEKLVREGCVTKDTGEELLRDQIFRLEHEEVDFSTFSESALRPLRREQDPEIQQKVIATVESAGNLKHENYGTERKMKAAIDRFHDVELEKPKPKEKKLWNAVERAEYTQAYVRTMIKNGVDLAVIRELVVKAIEVVGQE